MEAVVSVSHAREAKALVHCAQERGETLSECPAEVERAGDGRTTVTVAFPSGFTRRLTFTNGRFVRGDATMSGVGTDTDWTRENGEHLIRVDDQRFVIPDALVTPR